MAVKPPDQEGAAAQEDIAVLGAEVQINRRQV